MLSREPRKVWIEVLCIWAIALGVIFAFKLLSFVPFIKENLWGIAGLVFLFLPLEFLYRKKESAAAYGIGWQGFGRGLLLAGILMLITFPPYAPGYKLWWKAQEFSFALPGDFYKEVIGFFLLVALPEEAFYRGYMQTRLDHVFKGRVRILGAEVGWALVITAALFALGHLMEWGWQGLGTFFPGLVFGWMRARTGSIGGAVVFHAMCDIFAEVLKYGYFGVPAGR